MRSNAVHCRYDDGGAAPAAAIATSNRIAAKRVPKGVQLQLAVTRGGREFADRLELLAGEIFLAGPGVDDGQKLTHAGGVNRVALGRHELHGAPASTYSGW